MTARINGSDVSSFAMTARLSLIEMDLFHVKIMATYKLLASDVETGIE